MNKQQLMKQLEGIQDRIWELKEEELEVLEQLAEIAPEFKQQYEWLKEDMGLDDED